MSDVSMEWYQDEARRFSRYSESPEHWGVRLYPFFALSEEAGEVAGKVAKAMRQGADLPEDALALELGDVLWQISACANELGLSLSDIACRNIRKLEDRAARGVIVGEGDAR
jgi:NTP pyrophosphatase (non-canonical NTP hydrolase)